MAKNRNRKKLKSSAMEISIDTPAGRTQAMKASEAIPSNPSLAVINRSIKKSRAATRSKKLRKQKAIERAICKAEKTEEKACKIKNKVLRVQSAKSLYD
ncbi:uncharacterized protein LOC110018742 isoform X1 [Phalaenopsis equestris]|uniref:uncharacterized protein LOC110018742 isoform X1 n=1 Tax=Phalaenopsis equestris TaxID=78828 RepID=UPI0009E26622|nr:uncharacterized protein LOC110018742 isoform X1 [Phalaenopsis equestris]